MDFGLSEEQRLLQDTIQKLLADAYPTTRAREISATASAHDAALWTQLAENGALGALVAESHGGSSLSFLDAMLIAEEIGRAAGPGAYAATAVMAAVALQSASDTPLGKEILPELAAGRTRIGVALAEAHGARDGAGVRLERGAASGTALFALDAVEADRLLVHTPDGLALFSAKAAGVEVVPLAAVDRTRRIAELRFQAAEP